MGREDARASVFVCDGPLCKNKTGIINGNTFGEEVQAIVAQKWIVLSRSLGDMYFHNEYCLSQRLTAEAHERNRERQRTTPNYDEPG